MTTFSVFVRVRSIAEHACTEDTLDQFLNTRTTLAGFFARLTVAPHHVNYHLEHHLLMTTPHYRLKKMHRLLKERGVYESRPPAANYFEVLRIATSA
jgi:fatty acid desaturase